MLTGRGFDLLGGATVKSIQSGLASITVSASSEVNVAISAVDLTKAFAVASFYTNETGYYGRGGVIFPKLVNSTTLNIIVPGLLTAGSVYSVSWFVVELDNITVQRLDGSLGSGVKATDVTISQVNLSKTFLIAYGTATGGSNLSGVFQRAHLSNSTTVHIERDTAVSYTGPFYIYVISLP